MTDDASPQFLDLKSYRRRRFIDAVRLYPILAIAFLMFPLPFLFTSGGDSRSAINLVIYIFATWIVLIAVTLIVSRKLRDPAPKG